MGSARTGTATAGRVLPVVLASVVGALVLGILGMHALATHAAMTDSAHHVDADPESAATVTGTSASSMSRMSGMSDVRTLGAHEDPVSGASSAVSIAPDGESGHDGDGGHHGDAVVMLCSVMLAAAGVSGLVGLARRRLPRLWAYLIAAPTEPTAPRRSALPRRGTGPPPAWTFSVIRC